MSKSENSILLVDDEKHTLEYLSYKLAQKGYEVYTSTRGSDAIEKARTYIPNIILLDIMMPDMDGIETCIEMRKFKELNDTIIAFLSARNEDYTQIAGFEAGADDYIKKPIRLAVLISRLNALNNRKNRTKGNNIIEVKDIRIVKDRYKVIKDGKEINLPQREFELLTLLAKNPTKIFTREEIFSKVWSDDSLIGEGTINVHVSRIRSKLDPNIIKTIKGVGYRINI